MPCRFAFLKGPTGRMRNIACLGQVKCVCRVN